MKLGIVAGVESPLAKRLAWLTMLRLIVLAAFTVFIEAYYNRELRFGGFSSQFAIITVGAAFLLSAAYAALLRSGRKLQQIAYAQLITDQIIWTAIAYISGGVTSGVTSLYGLSAVAGAIVLGTRGTLLGAAAGMLCYTAMCVGFATELVPPPPDQVRAAYVTDVSDMIYPAFSALSATALVSALAAFLAERVRAFGGRLEAETRRAERAERLAMLGRLSAALAHEIRNPLGSIRGSIELLRTGGALEREDQRLCEIIEREASRLNDLVTDMVDLGRPRVPERVDTDLASVAQTVVKLARGSSRGEDVSIQYAGPESLMVHADPAQMRQVLWNLVRNAMQASTFGTEVTVKLSKDEEGAVRMSVSDEGAGIPDSSRDKIFDAFFTTRSHGVGIGLAVVKQVADAHGFDLEVESESEVGTTFSLRIPRASVLASVALLLSLTSCGGSAWMDAARSAPETPDEGEVGWTESMEEPKPEPKGAPPPGDKEASPEEETNDGEGGAAVELMGGKPQKGAATSFHHTYYDFPKEKDGAGATSQLFDKTCKPLRTVTQAFHDQVCVQGSGKLKTGETVSFARRDCECAAVCPRTGQKICFDLLDKIKFPFGRGATGNAITPLRTVAVDSSVIPLNTVLYISDFHGLKGPDGKAHDGCFVAQDRGLKVQGRHIDIFTGDPDTTRAWNSAVPTGKGVRVILDPPQCQHLKKR
ncbi:MAG TPA: ATP-binding protein [Polyangiaceae bacterium]|jgi:signal transduction histidine kinase/3D (Asp-Asp-Asp) domain-containing protein|nr:ATP-binding protein [Polyangiaceae bacterium]